MTRLRLLGLQVLSLFIVFCQSCASQSYHSHRGHRLFEQREFDQASVAFEEAAQKKSTNQTLFLLDAGASAFAAGQYDRAIKIFLEAERLCEIKDFSDLSEETGAIVTSDNIKYYRGEDWEKVMINVYLALSFTALGQWESAQVEARKINLLLYRLIHEGKRPYEESPFARYLSALLWEAVGEINSAYIDYKYLYGLDPRFPGLGSDLLRLSQRLGFFDDFQNWQRKFPETPKGNLKPNEAEVIVFVEIGMSPIKVERIDNHQLPTYRSRSTSDVSFQLSSPRGAIPSVNVLDFDRTSRKFLDDRIGQIAAKRLAGAVAKGILAAGVAKSSDNNDLGVLAFYTLMAMDRADTRSWRTLPASIHMVRAAFPEGRFPLRIEKLGYSRHILSSIDLGEIDIRAGKKYFFVRR